MLPPPTTMASSRSSSSRAVAISSARRSTTAASIVSSEADEARASPDILSTRRRRTFVVSPDTGPPEPVTSPCDLTADDDLGEAHNLGAPDQVGDGFLLVLGVRLLEQDPVLEPAVHPALDNFR